MEDVKKFEKKFGGSWVRIKFYKEMQSIMGAQILTDVSFCEALLKAKTSNVIVTPESISCLGAKYAFNWDEQADVKIIQECREKRNATEAFINSLIGNVPKLEEYFPAIGLNTDARPDVLISYLQPIQVMRLAKFYQSQPGRDIHVDVSSLMAVCGNIAVRSFLSQKISISFGCDESRLYGKIPRDRLIVGVPYSLIKTFL